MKRVSVYADQIKLFAITNKAGIKIKTCDIGEYLDYSNCNCRKKIADPLVEECTKNINETSLVKKTLDKNENKCNSYVVYKVLLWTFFIFFIIKFGIGIYFVYRNYLNRNKYELPKWEKSKN